ncbi:SGNH/GDSL hydrolase family protein [Robbsia sp. KACC 23696]|uniref:SGNH/GDSL hydrolase family protein n=1 Tax=Robbsia sp. KACC 23696 TaxID=3149231 RepID=UPI00325B7403
MGPIDRDARIKKTPHAAPYHSVSLLKGSAISLILASALTGCGGGDNNASAPASNAPGGVTLQAVSFGDSLSDVGTYASTTPVSGFTRGRYTTNPGEVWTQKVAEYYGGTLTPAALGGYGTPLVASSGLGYAQGGARVEDPDGEGHASSSEADYAAATTVPVSTQVSNYLAAHGSFNSAQIVLVNGGANDIFIQLTDLLTAIEADITGGMSSQAAIAQETLTTLVPAAQSLADTVGTILDSGATHVVVSNVPDIGQTPLGAALGTDAQAVLSGITQVFNTALRAQLLASGNLSKVIYVDAYSWQDNLATNYQSNGYTVSNTGTACNLAAMAAAATLAGLSSPTDYASSLYCTANFLTVSGADQTYMYADTVHPTTHTHALFAAYVEQQVAASGLGK